MLQTGIALGISLVERRQPRNSNRASRDPDLLRGNANPAIAFAYKFAVEVGPIRSAVGPGAHVQPFDYNGPVECLVISRADNHQARLERSEEHTSELQSLMRISYAVFCLKKKIHNKKTHNIYNTLMNLNITLIIAH